MGPQPSETWITPFAADAGGTTFDAADTSPVHSAMMHPTIAKVFKSASFCDRSVQPCADEQRVEPTEGASQKVTNFVLSQQLGAKAASSL